MAVLPTAWAQKPQSAKGESPYFKETTAQLHQGAASFSYTEEGYLMDAIVTFLDKELLKELPPELKQQIPPTLTARKIYQLLGLDRIKASGNSIHQVNENKWQIRNYLHIPEGRTGLLTVLGGAAEPFVMHSAAPEGVDFAFETQIQLKDLAAAIIKEVEAAVPAEIRLMLLAPLDQKNPMTGFSPRETLAKFDSH